MSSKQIKTVTNTRHLIQKMSNDIVSSTNWSAHFLRTDHCFYEFPERLHNTNS